MDYCQAIYQEYLRTYPQSIKNTRIICYFTLIVESAFIIWTVVFAWRHKKQMTSCFKLILIALFINSVISLLQITMFLAASTENSLENLTQTPWQIETVSEFYMASYCSLCVRLMFLCDDYCELVISIIFGYKYHIVASTVSSIVNQHVLPTHKQLKNIWRAYTVFFAVTVLYFCSGVAWDLFFAFFSGNLH